MAKMPAQYWMLRRANPDGTFDFKCAYQGTTPKLYLHKKVAESIGRQYGQQGWTAVPVSINFL